MTRRKIPTGNMVENWPHNPRHTVAESQQKGNVKITACPSGKESVRVSVCALFLNACESVGEVRGCEGEGYPTVSQRKSKTGREGDLLHVEKIGRWKMDDRWVPCEVALFYWRAGFTGRWRANSYREITAWHKPLSFIFLCSLFLFLSLSFSFTFWSLC